jgi:hypothetical protein
MIKLFFLLVCLAGCNQPAPPVPVRPAAPVPDAEIEKQTSQLRGLAFRRPVDYRLIARDELRAFLVKKIHEQYTEQELRDYGRSLAALGAIPEGTDVLAVMLSLYDEQVGAFYVPEERALYTFKDQTWSRGLDRMLLAHELTHALQDQNYDLMQWPLKLKDNDDRVLAAAALLEGDATMTMTRFYAENADRAKMLEDLGAMMGQNTAKLREAPAFLRETLLFPYVQGQQFVMALGNAEQINRALRAPPATTEEILHPDLYQRGAGQPAKAEPPALKTEGWRRIGDNVLGEFGIRVLLTEDIGAFAAQVAAAGWNGDRYHVYEHGPNGPTGVIWVTHWDTEEDAAEFDDSYRSLVNKRRVNALIRREGRRVTIVQSADPGFTGQVAGAN